jgi:hypothetical protein
MAVAVLFGSASIIVPAGIPVIRHIDLPDLYVR